MALGVFASLFRFVWIRACEGLDLKHTNPPCGARSRDTMDRYWTFARESLS